MQLKLSQNIFITIFIPWVNSSQLQERSITFIIAARKNEPLKKSRLKRRNYFKTYNWIISMLTVKIVSSAIIQIILQNIHYTFYKENFRSHLGTKKIGKIHDSPCLTPKLHGKYSDIDISYTMYYFSKLSNSILIYNL